MICRLMLTLGILTYALVVPLLEVNSSHVFDPQWTAHARLHEVWQLFTNTTIGLWALWRLWRHGDVQLAVGANLIVTIAFLVAYAIRDSYAGSMVLSDGSEKLVFGLNLGAVGFGFVVLITLAAWLVSRRT